MVHGVTRNSPSLRPDNVPFPRLVTLELAKICSIIAPTKTAATQRKMKAAQVELFKVLGFRSTSAI
ncbi:MAG: hypothetical protein ACJAXT_000908 [Paracoccaceae bacterium]|jgi:hypothetical protein